MAVTHPALMVRRTLPDALEHGTVQSYFTLDKIGRLIQDYFNILDGVHVCRTRIGSAEGTARFHMVLQKI